VQYANDGHSRRGNFGGSLGHYTFLMYSPDGTNFYGSRGGEFEGIRSVQRLKVAKIVFLGGTSYSLVHLASYCPPCLWCCTLWLNDTSCSNRPSENFLYMFLGRVSINVISYS